MSVPRKPAVAGPGCTRLRGFTPRMRLSLRVLAALANTMMCVYVYASYLARVEWNRFGSLVPPTSPHRLADLCWLLDFDAVFAHLRPFTFSEAMLHNLGIYLLVGMPVFFIYMALEWDRVDWLKQLLAEKLPAEEAARCARWLEAYRYAITIVFINTMALAPFHLDVPWAHYVVAGMGFSFGFLSMSLCRAIPIDFDALCRAARHAGDTELELWAWRVQHRVHPAMRSMLWFHALALAAGVWRVEALRDDRAALTFGILETMLIVAYQCFMAVLAVDDAMVGRVRAGSGERAVQKEPNAD